MSFSYAKYSKTEVFVTDCFINHETPKALLIDTNSGDARGTRKTEWLPKSKIEAYQGDTQAHNVVTVLVMPEWLAIDKGLPYDYSLNLQVELKDLPKIC